MHLHISKYPLKGVSVFFENCSSEGTLFIKERCGSLNKIKNASVSLRGTKVRDIRSPCKRKRENHSLNPSRGIPVSEFPSAQFRAQVERQSCTSASSSAERDSEPRSLFFSQASLRLRWEQKADIHTQATGSPLRTRQGHLSLCLQNVKNYITNEKITATEQASPLPRPT